MISHTHYTLRINSAHNPYFLMTLDTDLLLQQLNTMPDKHAQIRALDINARPDFVRFLVKSGIIVDSFDFNKVDWKNI